MRPTSRSAMSVIQTRPLLLAAISLNLLLITGRVVLYAPLWSEPDALIYLLEPVVLLFVYAAITVWITAVMTSNRRRQLVYGGLLGLITGVLWVTNLALETFANLAPLGLLATAPFLLGGFVLRGAAGFLTTRRTGSISSGIAASVWSAMICVLMTVTFGLLLTYTALPHLAHQLVADPDFLRSHWRDARAFAIANSFDSAFSHLLGGLVIGTIVGAAGTWLGLLVARGPSAGSEVCDERPVRRTVD